MSGLEYESLKRYMYSFLEGSLVFAEAIPRVFLFALDGWIPFLSIVMAFRSIISAKNVPSKQARYLLLSIFTVIGT